MKTHLLLPILATVIVLAGMALRLMPWGQNRFLEDEALYAYWGLQVASGVDPLLDHEPVDKPPLHPYILALSSWLFTRPPLTDGAVRAGEMAARLPSLFASVAGIALVYGLGCTLADARVALLAALLVALSPFDILFASTAFTDPLMTAFVLGALWAAAAGRLGASGVLACLAAATKLQGLYFLPLVVVLALRPPGSRRLRRSDGVRFVLGFMAIAAAVIGWDLARAQRPGFFEQSLVSYGGLRLVGPSAVGQRVLAWLRLGGYFWGSAWLNGLLVGALALWTAGSRICRAIPSPHRLDWILLLFVAGFLLLHSLVAFQEWDRYLLGLVPLVALLAARGLVALGKAIRPRPWQTVYATGLSALLVASLAGPVAHATRSELPVGGDHGAYDGIDDLALFIRSHAPPGAVLYHHWLGHHYRFYLYGAPLRLHWYPDPADLAHDAYVYRRETRYIAFPSWRDSTPMEVALNSAGIRLVPSLETTRRDGTVSFRLYRLEGP